MLFRPLMPSTTNDVGQHPAPSTNTSLVSRQSSCLGNPYDGKPRCRYLVLLFENLFPNILNKFSETKTNAATAGRADDGWPPLCGPGCYSPAPPTNTRLQYGPAVDGRGTHGRFRCIQKWEGRTLTNDHVISITLIFFSQDLVMEPSCCVLKIFTRS